VVEMMITGVTEFGMMQHGWKIEERDKQDNHRSLTIVLGSKNISNGTRSNDVETDLLPIC